MAAPAYLTCPFSPFFWEVVRALERLGFVYCEIETDSETFPDYEPARDFPPSGSA
jgi:hypothetical protein